MAWGMVLSGFLKLKNKVSVQLSAVSFQQKRIIANNYKDSDIIYSHSNL